MSGAARDPRAEPYVGYADSLAKLPLIASVNRIGRYAKRKPVRTKAWLKRNKDAGNPLSRFATGCAKKWVRQAARLRRHMDLATKRQRELSK